MISTHLKNVFRKFLFCFSINDSYLFKSLALAKKMSPYRLFIGNPNVGKSTLANCIAGRILFQSGIWLDRSLKDRLHKEMHDGIMYLDTPGLADSNNQRAAARAITEALRQNGKYQIFFVVSLEAERFRPEDLATIWLVLLNAPDITCFNIIINKVSKNCHDSLQDDNKKSELLAPLELMGEHKYMVLMLPFNRMLFDADNKIVDFPELVQFAEAAQWINIDSSSVSEIPVEACAFYEKMDILYDSIAQQRASASACKNFKIIYFL